MGQDKSQLIINGSTVAVRTAELLLLVAETTVEVGPGVSGLPATLEEPRGEGPLVAIAAGRRALLERGHLGAALVIACDLPFISEELLRYLSEWDSEGSVMPMVRGRPQPLCARWGGRDLDGAHELVDRGVRSLQHLATQPGVVLLEESAWKQVAEEEQFSDVDSPADLHRLGLTALFVPAVAPD
jgi:molybdopterin-guanine dinucleotide biosynthesis protein A